MDYDLELLDLCVEVYEHTKWEPETELEGVKVNGRIPIYTSDYVFEQLKRSISFHYQPKVQEWWANDPKTHIHRESDTALKALLKLVLALGDAGQLPNTNSERTL